MDAILAIHLARHVDHPIGMALQESVPTTVLPAPHHLCKPHRVLGHDEVLNLLGRHTA